jgi:hypothetical protein
MICAYALGALFVERLFKLVKPKLLKLAGFAAIWTWLVEARRKLSCRASRRMEERTQSRIGRRILKRPPRTK